MQIPELNQKIYTNDVFQNSELAENDPLLEYVIELIKEIFHEDELLIKIGQNGRPAIGVFVTRVISKEIDSSFFSNFIGNKKLHEMLNGFGYEIDKFWYLLLFISDYCKGYCSKGSLMSDHSIDVVEELVSKILANLIIDKDVIKISKKVNMKMIFQIEGQRRISIENPRTLHLIAKMLERSYEPEDDIDILTFNKYPLANSVHIKFFAEAFQTFYSIHPPKRKRQLKGTVVIYNRKFLISILVYITGLSTKKSLLEDDKAIKGFLKNKSTYEDLDIINAYYH